MMVIPLQVKLTQTTLFTILHNAEIANPVNW